MKHLLVLFVLCLPALLAGPARAQGMVSLSMGQPGFYGRIDISDGYPQPPLLLPNAVMGNPGVYTGQPVYMHVPPEHAHYWGSHCHRYGACDWMVYFVDNSWYHSTYVPGFRSGVFSYAPAPVYYAPPVYYPRPYYGHHYHGHRHHGHGHHHGHSHHHGHHGGKPHHGGGHSHHGGKPHGGGHPHGDRGHDRR